MTRRVWISAIACPLLLASLAAVVCGEEPASRPAEEGGRTRGAARQLWRAGLTPPPDGNSASNLDRAIRELYALQAAPTKPSEPPVARPSSQPASAPAIAPRPVEPASQPTSAPAVSRLTLATRPAALKGISPQTLEQLTKLAPKGLASPIELADALFALKEFDAATVLYSQAMEQEQDADNKAWALYQSANCRRQKDPAAARDIYKKLLTDYPSSLWSAAANAQSQLIEWQLANKPTAVLEELEKQTRKQEDAGAPSTTEEKR